MLKLADYDMVSYLTMYLFLLMFIPGTLIFAALGGSGTPSLVYALLLFLWYVGFWIAGRVAPSGGGRPVRIAMVIFALAVLASFVAGMTRDISQVEVLSAGRGLITFVAWAGLIVVTTQAVTSYERLSKLLRRAVIFGSIVGAIGIFEYYSGMNIVNYIHIPGLSANTDLTSLLARDGFNRPSSTAVDPIEFGVVMAMLLPLALQQAVSSPQLGNIRKWLPVALITFAIPVSLSRSGILGAVVACIILIPTWKRPNRHMFYVGTVIGLIVVKASSPGLLGTLINYFTGMFGSANNEGSVDTRTADYSRNWPYIVQRPLFGRGFETFLPQIYSWTDNMYLSILITTGVFGLASLLFLYFAGLHCAGAGRRRAQGDERRGLGQALVASIAVACVGSATFDALDFPIFAGLLFLLLGAAGAYPTIMTMESNSLPVLENKPWSPLGDGRANGGSRPRRAYPQRSRSAIDV
jgi:polysaccharide biosynthesis protein PslJ